MDVAIREKMKCFSERLNKCMEERGLNKSSFIRLINEKCDAQYSRNDLMNWLRIANSDIDSISGPKLKSVLDVASVLDVDVGYLLGEHDTEHFEAAEVSAYTGLSGEAVERIRKVTGTRTRYHDRSKRQNPLGEDAAKALELLLSSDLLMSFLLDLRDLERRNEEISAKFDAFESTIPTDIQDEVWKRILCNYLDTENEDGKDPRVGKAVADFDSAIDEAAPLSEGFELARYRLMRQFETVIDSLFKH